MNEVTLVRKNLTRKTLRTILLIISILIAFFIFGVLGSFNYAFNYAENPSSANRLITINKINFTQPLPHAYLGRIRRVEGVVAAAPMLWFGGYYREPQDQIQSFPTEPQALFDVYGEDIVLPADQKEAFLRDRTGIIVGRSIADRYGTQTRPASSASHRHLHEREQRPAGLGFHRRRHLRRRSAAGPDQRRLFQP